MRAIKTNLFLSIILLLFCSSMNAKSYLDQDPETEILSKILKEIQELKKSQEKTQKAIVELSNEVKALKGKNAAPNSNKGGAKDVAIGDSMVLGNPKAPVTIIKWTDYQWPYCAKSVSLIDEVLAKYPNDVKVVIKNFPLTSMHKQATKAAKYALAAGKQGKFKEMYHMIFCGTTESVPQSECTAWRKLKQNEDLPLEYAQALGLNIKQFESDVTDSSIENLIKIESLQLSQSFERKSVPKFLIQGKEPAGKRNLENWSVIIDAELKKIKKQF